MAPGLPDPARRVVRPIAARSVVRPTAACCVVRPTNAPTGWAGLVPPAARGR